MEVGSSTLIEGGDSRPQQRRSPRAHGGARQGRAFSSFAPHDDVRARSKEKGDRHATQQEEEEGPADDIFRSLSSKAPLISSSRGVVPPACNKRGPLSSAQRSAFKPVNGPSSATDDEATPNARGVVVVGAGGESSEKRPATAFAAHLRAAELGEASAVGLRSARPPSQPQSPGASSPRAPHVYGVGSAAGHARRPATAGTRGGTSPSPPSPSSPSAAVHPQRLFAFTMPSGEPQYMPPPIFDGNAHALPSPPSFAGANVGRFPRLSGNRASPAPLKAFPPAISSLRWRAISREGDAFTRNLVALSASATAAAAATEPFASPLLTTPRRSQVGVAQLTPSVLLAGGAATADAEGHIGSSAPAITSSRTPAGGSPPPASATNRPSSARQRPKPTPATFRSPQHYAQRFPGAIFAPRSATRRPDSAPANRGGGAEGTGGGKQEHFHSSSSVGAGGEDVNWSLSPSAAYRGVPPVAGGGEQPPSTPPAPSATARGDGQSQRSGARRVVPPSSPRGSSVFPPTRSTVVPDMEAPMRYWLAPAPAHHRQQLYESNQGQHVAAAETPAVAVAGGGVGGRPSSPLGVLVHGSGAALQAERPPLTSADVSAILHGSRADSSRPHSALVAAVGASPTADGTSTLAEHRATPAEIMRADSPATVRRSRVPSRAASAATPTIAPQSQPHSPSSNSRGGIPVTVVTFGARFRDGLVAVGSVGDRLDVSAAPLAASPSSFCGEHQTSTSPTVIDASLVHSLGRSREAVDLSVMTGAGQRQAASFTASGGGRATNNCHAVPVAGFHRQ